MRRSIPAPAAALLTATTALVAASLTLAAAPAAAAPTLAALPVAAALPAAAGGHGGWVPAPSEPWDRAAGVVCDFPLHGDAVVDEVMKSVLRSYPDGSPKREAYVGALVVRVTNTATGAFVDADAGGNAVIEYGTDGSMTWYVAGPVLIGFREGGGTLPRGMYILNGLFRLEFSATGYKTITMVFGTHDSLCDRLS